MGKDIHNWTATIITAAMFFAAIIGWAFSAGSKRTLSTDIENNSCRIEKLEDENAKLKEILTTTDAKLDLLLEHFDITHSSNKHQTHSNTGF